MDDFTVPDYQTQEKIRANRRLIANQLLQQSLQNQGQMVSGIYVPKSPWENVAQGFAGGIQNSGIDTEAQQQAKDLQDIRSRLLKQMPSQTTADESGGHTDPNYAAKLNKWGLQAGQVPGMEILAKESAQEVFAGPRRMAEIQERGAERKDTLRQTIEAATERERIRLEDKEAARQLSAEDRAAQSKQAAADREHLLRVAAGLRPTEAKAPSGYKINPDGSLSAIPGGPADPALKSPTESQGNALLFGTRALASHQVLGEIGTGYNPMKTAIARGVEYIPGANALSNAALNSNEQRVVQAQRDFVNAILRKESGAAISQSEFNNAQKQYFPQVGDKPEVLAQKQANRELAIKGMQSIAGRGATGSFEAVPAPAPAAPAARVKVGSHAEWQALTPGTLYETADGKKGVR